MPSATNEQRDRWESDSDAISYLESRGYSIAKGWTWKKPTPAHVPTSMEIDALGYLINEWDFGWLAEDQ